MIQVAEHVLADEVTRAVRLQPLLERPQVGRRDIDVRRVLQCRHNVQIHRRVCRCVPKCMDTREEQCIYTCLEAFRQGLTPGRATVYSLLKPLSTTTRQGHSALGVLQTPLEGPSCPVLRLVCSTPCRAEVARLSMCRYANLRAAMWQLLQVPDRRRTLTTTSPPASCTQSAVLRNLPPPGQADQGLRQHAEAAQARE